MKKLLLLFSAIGFAFSVQAQSDGCSAATAISVTPDCSSPTAGTTTGATQTIAGCTGNADDDVWYQFTATATSHQILVTPGAGMDAVVQLFSGPCSTLVSMVCKDDNGDGQGEIINYSGLSIGNTYRIRVYHAGAGSGTGNFTICVTNTPPPPANDDCGNAISLNINTSCTFTSATTDGATESVSGCSGFADDDVWFSFVATNSLANVLVQPIDNLDLVFQVYSGSCGNLSSLACVDNTLTGQNEQSDIIGLVPGQTYYIRIYDYYLGTTGDFDICITGTPTAVPTNDEPCTAILLPDVTSMCQYSNFTTVGATTTTSAPTPSSCAGGSGAAIGGYTTGTQDVWFQIVVPSTGNLDITPQPNGGAGSISDGVMALYSGTCNSLTQIACADDNNYPGTGNDLLPLISETGLTPGDTLYLRYWGFGTSSGTFGICASTTTNDDCANALYICDINGYSASTSPSYTPDRPDNMRGNNEDINGNNMPDGVNTGGIFGQGGPWGTGAPFFDVIINNNSWIKFTASSTTATLDVAIFDCWVGNYPSGGLQMQIFEGTNCTNFVPVSNFEESSTGFTITANNLTVGNDYYLMIDGYAGDICNYTITANSGVQFPDIADVAPICQGDSVTLTAPAGAVSYEWQHNGATMQSVTVTPSTTETYYCEVTGLCDYKQLLDVTVTINPLPNVQITNGTNISVCENETVDLTATGATGYVWSTSATTSVITVLPLGNESYTVTGTDTNGCVDSATVNITLNLTPTLSATPSATDADCGASNGALTGTVVSGTPNFSYDWHNGTSTVGTNANLSGIPAGTYTLTVTDGNNCSATFGPYSVVNPGAPPAPTISGDFTVCPGDSIILVASNSMSGVTYTWTGPNGFTAATDTALVLSASSINDGTYCVYSTFAGCSGPATCQNVVISSPPTMDITALYNDSTICEGDTIQLFANQSFTLYDWNGPNGFTSTSDNISVFNADPNNAGIYTVIGTSTSGCLDTASINIAVIAPPSITITADANNAIYCNGAIANLTASGGVNYVWNGPNGFTDSSANVSVLNLNAQSQGVYTVWVQDAEMCEATDTVFLTVITDVPADADAEPLVCPGDPVTLSSTGGVSQIWSGPNNYSSQEQNPVVTTNSSSIHSGWYYLTVVDANGCLGYDSVQVSVETNSNCLLIPNLITPDGDFMNDTWTINGIENFPNAEVEIYNRWGNLVYYSSPYMNDWDGAVNRGATIDGNDGKVPVGTYFYILRLNVPEKPDYKGYVEVQY